MLLELNDAFLEEKKQLYLVAKINLINPRGYSDQLVVHFNFA